MKQVQIEIKDYAAYVVRYKVTTPGCFVISLNEDYELAGWFDDDDAIIALCQQNFKQVVLEPFPTHEESLPKLESFDASLDWM